MPLWLDVQATPRQVKRLRVEARMFLEILRRMDGRRRMETLGLPADAHAVGISVDRALNTIDIYLESEAFAIQSDQEPIGDLDVTFREFFGDAGPGTPGLT